MDIMILDKNNTKYLPWNKKFSKGELGSKTNKKKKAKQGRI